MKDGALTAGQKLGRLAIGGVHSAASGLADRVVPSGLLRRLVQSGLSAGNTMAQEELVAYLEGLKQSRHGSGLYIQFTKPAHKIIPVRVNDIIKTGNPNGLSLTNINRPLLKLDSTTGSGLFLTAPKRGR